METLQKRALTNNHTQFISINNIGEILTSDDNLIPFEKGKLIQTYHPFFEIVTSCIEENKKHARFEAVHLAEYIYDIDIVVNDRAAGVVILREATEFYTRIQEIAQKRNESVIHSQTLEISNKELQDKELIKNKFITNFAHELRNPLTLITAFSSILNKTDLDTNQESVVKSIIEQGSKIKNIINDIIDLTDLKNNLNILESNAFNMHDLLEQFKFNQEHLLKQQQTVFTYNQSIDLPQFAIGDPRRIEKMLVNMVEYAMLYNSGQNLTMALNVNHKLGLKCTVSVSLTNIVGMVPESYKSNLNVSTGSNLKTKNLGLSITKEIATLLGGTHKVDTDSNGVCTQHLIFTILESTRKIEVKDKSNKKIKYQTKLNLKEKIKILIAEDTGVAQLTAIKVLTNSGNFDTVVFSNPKDLLEAVELNDYDVIIMADSLSQIDAVELIGLIKSFGNDHNKKIPVIALTTDSSSKIATQYRKSGFDDILKKPYTDDELLDVIYKKINVNKFL